MRMTRAWWRCRSICWRKRWGCIGRMYGGRYGNLRAEDCLRSAAWSVTTAIRQGCSSGSRRCRMGDVMSMEAMRWVWGIRDIHDGPRLVLLALAYLADAEGAGE